MSRGMYNLWFDNRPDYEMVFGAKRKYHCGSAESSSSDSESSSESESSSGTPTWLWVILYHASWSTASKNFLRHFDIFSNRWGPPEFGVKFGTFSIRHLKVINARDRITHFPTVVVLDNKLSEIHRFPLRDWLISRGLRAPNNDDFFEFLWMIKKTCNF